MRLALCLGLLAGALAPVLGAEPAPVPLPAAAAGTTGQVSSPAQSVSVNALPGVQSAPLLAAPTLNLSPDKTAPEALSASPASAPTSVPGLITAPSTAASPANAAAAALGSAPAGIAAGVPAGEAPAGAPASAALPAAPGTSAADAPPAAAPGAAAANAEAVANAAFGTPVVDDKDLWGRIRRGFKMPDLTTKRAQASTRWYAAKPEYIARMTGRASMYLYHIVDELEKRGMPTELALLPFVESAMQPEAVSFAKAAGLWQFIPSTGRLYALEQNLWKDERFGVIESTRAALDYLQKLYAEFGDWQLALAAYNCGEAGVERALAKARAAHRSVAYQDLRLPNETQYYVPKLQAIKNIVADPQRFGIELPQIRNEPYFVTVNKTLDIDVATAARLADMPLDDFRALNPAYNRPVIVGASSPNILLPADRADTFNANLAAWQATGQPLASWTAYTLQPGEVLAKVAERVGITEAQLREANHIPPRYRAAAGSTILIPRDEANSDDIAPGFMTASFALIPENGNQHQVSYRVRRGDTLASVARRWHVNADDIVAWNQLHTTALFTGQRLTLTVTHTAAPAAHKTAAKKSAPAAGATRATGTIATGAGKSTASAARVQSAGPSAVPSPAATAVPVSTSRM